MVDGLGAYIPCDNHDWVQSVPLSKRTLTCLRCDFETPIRSLGNPGLQRCSIHLEAAESGFTDLRSGKHWANGKWHNTPNHQGSHNNVAG